MYLAELMNVNDAQQTFQVDLIILQEWYDFRLNFNDIQGTVEMSDPSLIERFWTPDLYIINAQSASIINSFHSVQKLTITEAGLMHYSMRVHSTLHCSMNLEKYPHDYQYCYIRFSSSKSFGFLENFLFLTLSNVQSHRVGVGMETFRCEQ